MSKCHHGVHRHNLTKYIWLQNLNILMLGAKDGKGGFFPEGIAGRINTPEGFDKLAEGVEDWDGKEEAIQVRQCIQKACAQRQIAMTTSNDCS